MEGKTYRFYSNTVQLKAGKDGYFVSGYVVTDELDTDNEIVPATAHDSIVAQLKSGRIKADIEHETFRGKPDIPIGTFVDAKRVTEGGMRKIWAKCKLNENHRRFKEVWKSLKAGHLDGFSIAYDILDAAWKMVNGIRVRFLKSISLLNIALTGIPVNRGAKIQATFMKSVRRALEADGVKAMEKDGVHVHTDSAPMGEHSHPEIEKALGQVDNRFERVWDYIYKLEKKLPGDEDEAKVGLLAKGKADGMKDQGGDETVTEEGQDASAGADAAADAKKEDAQKGAEDQGDNDEQKDAGAEGSESFADAGKPAGKDAAAGEPAKGEDAAGTASKSVGPLDQVKSLAKEVDGLKSLVKNQAEQISNLNKLLEKPQLKGRQSAPAEPAVSKKSPLDYID